MATVLGAWPQYQLKGSIFDNLGMRLIARESILVKKKKKKRYTDTVSKKKTYVFESVLYYRRNLKCTFL